LRPEHDTDKFCCGLWERGNPQTNTPIPVENGGSSNCHINGVHSLAVSRAKGASVVKKEIQAPLKSQAKHWEFWIFIKYNKHCAAIIHRANNEERPRDCQCYEDASELLRRNI
jgi:hypothetical protein